MGTRSPGRISSAIISADAQAVTWGFNEPAVVSPQHEEGVDITINSSHHHCIYPNCEKTGRYAQQDILVTPSHLRQVLLQDAGSGVPYIVLWQVLRRHYVY